MVMDGVKLDGLDSSMQQNLGSAIVAATKEVTQLSVDQSSTCALSQVTALTSNSTVVNAMAPAREIIAQFIMISKLYNVVEALVSYNSSSSIDTTSSLDDIADAVANQLYADSGNYLAGAVADSYLDSSSGTDAVFSFAELFRNMETFNIDNVTLPVRPTVIAFWVTSAPSTQPSTDPAATRAPTSSGGRRRPGLAAGVIAGIAISGAVLLALLCFVGLFIISDDDSDKKEKSEETSSGEGKSQQEWDIEMAKSPSKSTKVVFESTACQSAMHSSEQAGVSSPHSAKSPLRSRNSSPHPSAYSSVTSEMRRDTAFLDCLSECTDSSEMEMRLALSMVELRSGTAALVDVVSEGDESNDANSEQALSPVVTMASLSALLTAYDNDMGALKAGEQIEL
jgi:hypothetical protein